jgi:hypothetical protein
MRADVLLIDDDPALLAAAVRLLAADVHQVLTGDAASGTGHAGVSLAALQQRAACLLDRTGEDQTGDGRLDALRR